MPTPNIESILRILTNPEYGGPDQIAAEQKRGYDLMQNMQLQGGAYYTPMNALSDSLRGYIGRMGVDSANRAQKASLNKAAGDISTVYRPFLGASGNAQTPQNRAILGALSGDPATQEPPQKQAQISKELIDAFLRKSPASIRYNNPGAQYPGKVASAFGSSGAEIIGGGHKIAKFDDPVQGAAAQFALLAQNYSGLPLGAAITKWSGGNSSGAYISQVARETGLDPGTPITPQLLSSPLGLALVKSMSKHEAGRPYPLSDDQWARAQTMVFGGGAAPSAARDNASPGMMNLGGPRAAPNMSTAPNMSVPGQQQNGGTLEMSPQQVAQQVGKAGMPGSDPARTQPASPGGLPTPLGSPAANINEQQLQAILANPFIDAGVKNSLLQMIQQRAQPQTIDTLGGTLQYDPRQPTNRQFFPKILESEEKTGDITRKGRDIYDPNTGQLIRIPKAGANQGQGVEQGGTGQSGSGPDIYNAPNNLKLEPFNENWPIERQQNWLDTRKVQLKAAETASEAMTKSRTTYLDDAINEGKAAKTVLKNLQVMATAQNLGNGKIPAGPFANWSMDIKKAITELTGINFEGVPPAEVLNKIGTSLAASASKAEIGNRITQSEFTRFLETGVPNLTQTEEGRKLLLDILMQDAKRRQDLGNMALKANSPAEFFEKEKTYLSDPDNAITITYKGNTLNTATAKKGETSQFFEKYFGTSGSKKPNVSNGAPQFNEGDTATHPQTGEKRVYRNGQWVGQ